MPTISVNGFEGILIVSMVKAINEHTGIGLAKSKAITDKLLMDEFVTIEVSNMEVANALVVSLKAANANAKIIKN